MNSSLSLECKAGVRQSSATRVESGLWSVKERQNDTVYLERSTTTRAGLVVQNISGPQRNIGPMHVLAKAICPRSDCILWEN